MSEQSPSDEIIQWMKDRHPERFGPDGRATLPPHDQIVKDDDSGIHGVPVEEAPDE